jgi:hypothetical protein
MEIPNCATGIACLDFAYFQKDSQTSVYVRIYPTDRVTRILPDSANPIVAYEEPHFLKSRDDILVMERSKVSSYECRVRVTVFRVTTGVTAPVGTPMTEQRVTSCGNTTPLLAHTTNSLQYMQVQPTRTPTPTATSTPTATWTSTFLPSSCPVTRILFSGGVKFRTDWVPDPQTNTVNILFLVGTRNNALQAETWQHPQGPTGEINNVTSLVVTEWMGVHPSALTGQQYRWLRVEITLSNGTIESGAMGYDGASEGTLLLLGCDLASLVNYPTPSPTPTSTPTQVRYISCLANFGLGPGIDRSNTNIRNLINPTGIVRSIVVNASVLYVGHQNDATVQSIIGSIVNGQIVPTTPSLLDPQFATLPPDVREQGFSLVEWDDNDATTVNSWWIVSTVLKVEPDCGEPVYTPTNSPPTLTPTSVYQVVYASQQPIYPTVIGVLVNPPAVMGQGGLHPPVLRSSLLTVDTVPLNVESCVDAGICNRTYNPNDAIPVLAPVSGCFERTGQGEATLKVGVNASACNNEPQIHIGFAHLNDDQLLSQFRVSREVVQGQVIGFLCPYSSPALCNLRSTDTHLAVTLRAYRVRIGYLPASIDELLRLLPRLHDCFNTGTVLGTPIPAQYVQYDLCE